MVLRTNIMINRLSRHRILSVVFWVFVWDLSDLLVVERGVLDFPDENETLPPSNATLGVYSKAAVVANSEFCADIGKSLLERGGSAVDAIIGTALCEGLCSMQNMGLGGGLVMTIYNRKERRAYSLNARETAPSRAHRNMFTGNANLSSQGGQSISVPGELMGYWEAHKRFGSLPWREVVAPALAMAESGVPVNHRLARSFRAMADEIHSSPDLCKILSSNHGGRLPVKGERLKMPELASTLAIVANSPRGAMELYNGVLTQRFVDDLARQGSLITYKDMCQYRAEWSEPVCGELSGGFRLYSVAAPASGHLLSFILRVLDSDLLIQDPRPNTRNTFAIAEAFKFAYGLRSRLGDPNFVNLSSVLGKLESEDYIAEVRERITQTRRTSEDPKSYGAEFWSHSDRGTINTVALAPNGDAVCATSTINTLFGAMVASGSTGIMANNEMDDFSCPNIVNSFGVPPSPSNYIQPGKRPLSSMCPSIVVDREGDVRMVIGAAGGTHITTATAQVIIRDLWLGQDLKMAVDAPRIHHQLLPMVLKYEYGLPKVVVDGMESRGHKMRRTYPHSSVTAISQHKKGCITAMYDFRRGGSTAGY